MSFLLGRVCESGGDSMGGGRLGWSELVYTLRMIHGRTCGANIMDMAHRLAVAKGPRT